MALVTKHFVNTWPRRVIHFIVEDAAALMVKLEQDIVLQCTEVSGCTICVVKHVKTRLGSSFTVRILA